MRENSGKRLSITLLGGRFVPVPPRHTPDLLVVTLLFTWTMAHHQVLLSDIAAISALHKAGHSTRALSDQMGVSVRKVQ